MVCAPVRKDNPLSFSEGIISRTGPQTMLYLTFTIISSVNLAHQDLSLAKDWISVDCSTSNICRNLRINLIFALIPDSSNGLETSSVRSIAQRAYWLDS